MDYSHSRLEAAPTLLMAASWERLPAANGELCGKKLHRFDTGHVFMGQQ
jgi:hypothetical protein